MEDRAKQTEAFAKILEMMNVPVADRPQMMRGVDLFFDRGWPSNHFTVGMAAQAGAGLIPPVYEGIGSEAKYKALMDSEGPKNRAKTIQHFDVGLSHPFASPASAGRKIVARHVSEARNAS